MKCIALIDLAARFLPTKFPGPIEVSVLWTDDLTIAELNQQFRSKSGATNILSFPSGDRSALMKVGCLWGIWFLALRQSCLKQK